MRVLCATDLSSRSRYAVHRAALFANRFDALLVLLHVVEPDERTAPSLQARERVAQQLTSIASSTVHEPVIELRAGDYIQSIATVAKETHADLIILGSQKNALASLIGTAAERITELSGRPACLTMWVSRGGVGIGCPRL
jgi:nucleotide-binding universal stress UspA family protein